MTKKLKKLTRGKIVKKLDAVFSRYVRHYYSDTGKTVKCYTCGERKPIKKMQNGHRLSRRYYRFRWDINNCRVQCPHCNIFLKGNYIIYTRKMIDELGIDIVDKMIKEKDKLYKISTQELIELTDKYTQLLEDMQK